MKVAFHFSSNDPTMGTMYGLYIDEQFFRRLLSLKSNTIFSDVYCGDLSLRRYRCRVELSGRNVTYICNSEKFKGVFNEWSFPRYFGWNRLVREKLDRLSTDDVYVLTLDNLQEVTAEELDVSLRHLGYYLFPYVRIAAPFEAKIFHDAGEDIMDFQDVGVEEMLRAAGFSVVNYVQHGVDLWETCNY